MYREQGPRAGRGDDRRGDRRPAFRQQFDVDLRTFVAEVVAWVGATAIQCKVFEANFQAAEDALEELAE
ncbi:MAG: hypothetical protein U5K70_04405 [Halodesulfurarchaeum sp.]|nr:hypothetical protein [Halodesulfurarchaeum sp.]